MESGVAQIKVDVAEKCYYGHISDMIPNWSSLTGNSSRIFCIIRSTSSFLSCSQLIGRTLTPYCAESCSASSFVSVKNAKKQLFADELYRFRLEELSMESGVAQIKASACSFVPTIGATSVTTSAWIIWTDGAVALSFTPNLLPCRIISGCSTDTSPIVTF